MNEEVKNLNTEEEIQKAVTNISNKIEESRKEKKNLFEELMASVEQINPTLGGFDELSMLLSLPEDQFSLIAPIFMDELQKSMNNTNDKMLMVQAMNVSGVKMEDLQNEFVQITEEIDNQFKTIPAIKKDFLKNMIAIIYNMVADASGVAKKIIQIPIELCHPDAKMPEYANTGDAGMDIFALEDVTINPGETKLIPTGIKVAIPFGYELQVRPKSGRALKTKMRVANTPGTIDSGYRDEIGVIIDNIEPPIKDITYEPVLDEKGKIKYLNITSLEYGNPMYINKGEKFAQLVLSEVPKAAFYEVENILNYDGDRGGGFGSSGLK